MALAGGVAVLIGFIILMKLFGLVEKSIKVVDIAKLSITIVQNKNLNDYQKESMMKKNAKELFSLFFLITIGGIAALAIPFSLIWLMELTKLLTVSEVIETTLSVEFIIITIIISIGWYWLIKRTQ